MEAAGICWGLYRNRGVGGTLYLFIVKNYHCALLSMQSQGAMPDPLTAWEVIGELQIPMHDSWLSDQNICICTVHSSWNLWYDYSDGPSFNLPGPLQRPRRDGASCVSPGSSNLALRPADAALLYHWACPLHTHNCLIWLCCWNNNRQSAQQTRPPSTCWTSRTCKPSESGRGQEIPAQIPDKTSCLGSVW